MATMPYQQNGQWWIDVDPDDHNYVVANVANDLTDRATTATSVQCVLSGVTVLSGPQVQGSLMIAMVTIDQTTLPSPSTYYCTFRVACANGERFDRTIYFNLVQH